MDYDERSIRDFLKGHPGRFVSPCVISRRVGGKRRYLENPQWATPVLTGMLDKGILEADARGHYRLKKVDPAARGNRLWMSPQVKRMLERSSKDFSKVINLDIDEDEFA